MEIICPLGGLSFTSRLFYLYIYLVMDMVSADLHFLIASVPKGCLIPSSVFSLGRDAFLVPSDASLLQFRKQHLKLTYW